MTGCEWPGCQAEAEGEVNAQWTIVDFVAYAACGEHRRQMLEQLARRRVDGELPVDVWETWWWPPAEVDRR